MGVLDAWLFLYIPHPSLYNKTHIQSVYNAIWRKLKPGSIFILDLIGEEYHYTLRLIRWLHTFNLRFKNSRFGLQSIYMYEKIDKIVEFIKRMRWKTHLYLNPSDSQREQTRREEVEFTEDTTQ